jgi:hypothetical protein
MLKLDLVDFLLNLPFQKIKVLASAALGRRRTNGPDL